MLTEKDYCNYDTCVALKKLGFNDSTDLRYNHSQTLGDFLGGVKAPTLYEAQKWLREEKKIIVETTFNLMYKGQPCFSWRVLYNLTQHEGAYYTFDSVKSIEDYNSFEEALSEGILDAIEILKENETIHE